MGAAEELEQLEGWVSGSNFGSGSIEAVGEIDEWEQLKEWMSADN